jgi:hypothetical protein
MAHSESAFCDLLFDFAFLYSSAEVLADPEENSGQQQSGWR